MAVTCSGNVLVMVILVSKTVACLIQQSAIILKRTVNVSYQYSDRKLAYLDIASIISTIFHLFLHDIDGHVRILIYFSVVYKMMIGPLPYLIIYITP